MPAISAAIPAMPPQSEPVPQTDLQHDAVPPQKTEAFPKGKASVFISYNRFIFALQPLRAGRRGAEAPGRTLP